MTSGPIETRDTAPPMWHREAERAVLGSCLTGRIDVVQEARAVIGPYGSDAFAAVAAHPGIWRAICALADGGVTPDVLTVQSKMQEIGERFTAGSDDIYLLELVAGAPVVPNPAHYREVAGWARLRRMWRAGTRIVQRSAMTAENGLWFDKGLDRLVESYQDELMTVGSTEAKPRLRDLLLDSAGLDLLPAPEPLIKGVLTKNTLAWLAGSYGSYKSFVGLDMAGCVGSGIPWQGFPTTKGVVLYMVAEGAAGTPARKRAWEEAMGQVMSGVYWLPIPVNAADPPQWNEFCALAKEVGAALIVIDTQARVTLGWDENTTRDMGLFVDKLEKLKQVTGACVLTVHHTGHAGEHMRGSSSVPGAADTILHVASDESLITVSVPKQKDSPSDDEITLRVVPTLDSLVLMITDAADDYFGPDDSHNDPRQSKPVMRMLRTWWKWTEGNPDSVANLVEAGVIKKATFYKWKKDLIAFNFVGSEGTGQLIKYRLLRSPDEAG